jgi:hypothetical protein
VCPEGSRCTKSGVRPRIAHIPFALLGVYVTSVIASAAWVTEKMWDDRTLEAAIYDNSWLIQLPWRATRGEWVGRDFAYPLGPLWQWLSWAATGFHFHSPAQALGSMELWFPALSMLVALWVSFSHLRQPRTRFVALAALAAFILFNPKSSIRYTASLWLVFVFAAGELESNAALSFRDRRLWRWALSVAAVATIALLLSFERGVMAVASIGAMMAYGFAVRRWARLPLRPTLVRYGAVIAAVAAVQLLLALVAAGFGASYFRFIADSLALSRSYTTGMPVSFDPASGPRPESVYAVAFAAALAAAVFASAKCRDLHAGALLVGSLPLVVTAMVRSDTGHVWQGIVPAGAALALVGLMQMEQGRIGRFLLCSVPAALLILGWYGSFGSSEKNRLLLLDAWRVKSGKMGPERGYQTNLTRIVGWAREEKAAGRLPCVGAFQGADVVHALADVPGPSETMLRWSTALQDSLAARIRRERCPYYIQDLPSFVYGAQNFYFGEDFTTLAELYEPVERLGPAVFVTKLRDRPAPARVRDSGAMEVGVWRNVPVPGDVEVHFREPLSETDLLRIDYTIEGPEWARYLGGTPKTRIAFARGVEEPWVDAMVQLQQNRRTVQLVAVHSWAAEWRWIAGRAPTRPRSADRMRLRFFRRGGLTPHALRIKIHSIQILSPGAEPLPVTTGEAIAGGDLVDALRKRVGYPVSSAPALPTGEQGFVLAPNNDKNLDASVYFPLRPVLGSVLLARVGLDRAPPGGDGADVDLELEDPLGDPIKTSLARVALEPNATPTELGIPLDPWVGRDVLLRITSNERKTVDFDWVRFKQLELVSNGTPATLAGALRSGIAKTEDAHPRLEGSAVFLHPNGTGTRPARVVLPLRPGPADCVLTGLEHRGKGGDGVVFAIAVRDEDGETPLLLERLSPGTRKESVPGLSLAQWAGRNVELVFVTLPGGNSTFDWAYFLHPRVARGSCGLLAELGSMVHRGTFSKRAGEVSEVRGSVVLGVDREHRNAEAAFRVQPEAASCFSAWVRLGEGEKGNARFEVRVEDAGESVRLFEGEVPAGEIMRPDPARLAAWAGRPVNLVLSLTSSGGDVPLEAYFDAAVVRRCFAEGSDGTPSAPK